jgi:hypothetical protein
MALRYPPPRTAEVIKTEEKGSDVNLATYLMLDACRRDCDVVVLALAACQLPPRFVDRAGRTVHKPPGW